MYHCIKLRIADTTLPAKFEGKIKASVEIVFMWFLNDIVQFLYDFAQFLDDFVQFLNNVET